MFQTQLFERKKYKYPPFCRLIRITLKHPDKKVVAHASQQLATELTRVFGTRILGPEEPVIGRVQNKHLQTLLIKIEKELNIQKSKEIIRQSINNLLGRGNMRNLQVIADVDPL
jgi:primosomal protein N' (replication factor Y) (superfamily II helicase)